ncbi:MAG TPA: GDSL-type esterase/lipase family protein [Phycisphaerae bacterium]|nr:GDSL-type esterase/lipase family protein [Phycisphaerae bacterium]
MKERVIPVFLLLGALVSFARAQSPAPGRPTKPSIFVCGDSTSHFTRSETIASDMQGWGTPLALFFDPDKVTVKNVGHAGQSSRTYYNGDWPKVLPQIEPGDFVLIVFGINDAGPPHTVKDRGSIPGTGDDTLDLSKPDGTTETVHSYGWYMSKMTTDAEAKGAHVVLLTVTTRNIWSNPAVKFKDATPVTTLPADYDRKLDRIERGTDGGKYTQWTGEIGQRLHVPVFDLTDYCADRYEAMGREEVNKLYRDHNHTHAAGAKIVAESIISGLKALKDSPFTPLLSDAGKALPTAAPKYVSDNHPETK